MKEIDKSVIKDYKSGMKPSAIIEKYNFKSSGKLYSILNKYNIPRKRNKWNKKQIEFLLNNYATCEWEILLKELHPISKDVIIHKACELNLTRRNTYSKEEVEILNKYYGTMSIEELKQKYLPSRTESSIMTKANRLGLVSREKWTDEENKLLIKLYSSNNNEDLSKTSFPNRTISAIKCQADKLGLVKNLSRKEYTEEYLIEKLREFAEKLGRTPSSEEVQYNDDLPALATYHRYFNGYNNACLKAGLELNPINIFGKESFYLSSNGDICFSKAELIITEALIKNKINYKKEVYYKDIIDDNRCGNKRCDWFINNKIVLEYFGMPEKSFYLNKMNEKINICNDNNITLIQLFRKDLRKINKIIKNLSQSEIRND